MLATANLSPLSSPATASSGHWGRLFLPGGKRTNRGVGDNNDGVVQREHIIAALEPDMTVLEPDVTRVIDVE